MKIEIEYDYDSTTGIVSRVHDRLIRSVSKNGRVYYRKAGYPLGPVGTLKNNGYLYAGTSEGLIAVHRIAWYLVHREWPEVIDHVNGDKVDNRLVNLRASTKVKNGRNRRPKKDGLPIGVSQIPGGQYHVTCSCGKVRKATTVATLEQAREKRKIFEAELWND